MLVVIDKQIEKERTRGLIRYSLGRLRAQGLHEAPCKDFMRVFSEKTEEPWDFKMQYL